MSAPAVGEAAPRRPSCPQCLRPANACLCFCIRHVPSAVQLLVLQHPDEAGHAKNTARLLHLCVPGSRLEVGEQWEPKALQALLHGNWGTPANSRPRRTVLLYPPTAPDPQLSLVQPPAFPAHWLDTPAQLRLVVIDGTWRKSRKMLYLNAALQLLPRWSLEQDMTGRYCIRKAHAPGQLSSFEAAAYALSQLNRWNPEHPGLQQWMQVFEAAMQHHQRLQKQRQREK